MDDRYNAYKDMLLDLSQKIDKDDLHRMKFKCDQIIKKRQNEKIALPTELFTALEERGYLGETKLDYLKDLLKTCCSGKVDGLRVLESYALIFIPGYVPNEQTIFERSVQSQDQYAPGIPQQPQIVYVAHNGSVYPGTHREQRQRYEGPDLGREISFLCRSLGRDWKFYFRALGLPEDEIEVISCDYRTVRERIHQCLLAWQQQEQQGASRDKLIDALRHSSIQRNDLASKLEEGRY